MCLAGLSVPPGWENQEASWGTGTLWDSANSEQKAYTHIEQPVGPRGGGPGRVSS